MGIIIYVILIGRICIVSAFTRKTINYLDEFLVIIMREVKKSTFITCIWILPIPCI